MSLSPNASSDSRHRILEAATNLFASKGFSDTSMRAITTEAKVNLASVNYYFGSKDGLIVEVLSNAIRPLNKQRLDLLQEAIDQHSPDPVPIRKTLNALIRPCLQMSHDPERQQTFQLLGRSLSEEGNFIHKIIEKEWTPVAARFVDVLQKAVPGAPREEIFWRIHFSIGALIHTTCHHQSLTQLSAGLCQHEFEPVLVRLLDFAEAGLLAADTDNVAA